MRSATNLHKEKFAIRYRNRFWISILKLATATMIGLLLASSVTGQTQTSQSREYPTLFVLVTPSQLLTKRQVVGPRVIDEVVRRRNVASHGIATTNIRVESVASPDSAMLRLKLDGLTDGSSVSSIHRREVLSDDLSRFRVDQQFELTANGLSALRPTVQMKTHRELNHIESNRIVGRYVERYLTSSAFFAFQQAIDRHASTFSEQKLREELSRHRQTLDDALNRAQTIASGCQVSDTFFPEWQGIQISSTDRVWRFKAGSQTCASKPPPLHVLPVSVRVHKSPLNSQLQRDFGGKTLTSLKLDNLRNKIGERFQLPSLEKVQDKPWSITFAEQAPLKFEFEEDSILLSLAGQKFTSGDQTTPALTITVRYRLQFEDQQWFAVRDERVEVESGSEGQLGGRQQVIKTVTRRRFERLFPEKLALPVFEFAGIDRSSENSGRTLVFKTVAAQDGWISFALGHKN